MSVKAASMVAKKGYSNVMTFKAGLPAWVMDGNILDIGDAMPMLEVTALPPKKVKSLLGKAFILDLRPPSLFKQKGWIKRAFSLPLAYLSKQYQKIPTDKLIIVVDHSGKESTYGARFLMSKGYKNVIMLEGGLDAWEKKGFELKK